MKTNQEMNRELDAILNDTDISTNTQVKFEVNKIVDLLEELQVSMATKFEREFKPVYKTDFSICRLPEIQTGNEKLLLSFLQIRGSATTAEIIEVLDMNRMTVGRTLNQLMSIGYVTKVRTGQYAITENKIF